MAHVENSEGITPTQQMMSSCSGALLTSLLMTPLDVVKVRLQAQQNPFKPGSCFVYSNGLCDFLCVCTDCTSAEATAAAANGVISKNGASLRSRSKRLMATAWYERPGHFSGMTDAFIKISRNEGVTALWSGLPPTLLMSIPMTVVYFTAYDQLKYAMGYREHDPSTKYVPIAAGMIARTAASTIFSPVELMRVKLQSQQLTYAQLTEAVRTSVRAHGTFYLWNGLVASLLRDVPFSGIYWFGYEFVKAQIIARYPDRPISFLETFFSGATAGTVAAVITLPFDVIKTKRQIQLGQAEVSSNFSRVLSTRELLSQLYKQDGLAAFFAGITPRILKVAPACAIMISTYEFSKRYFLQRNAAENTSV